MVGQRGGRVRLCIQVVGLALMFVCMTTCPALLQSTTSDFVIASSGISAAHCVNLRRVIHSPSQLYRPHRTALGLQRHFRQRLWVPRRQSLHGSPAQLP